MFPDNNNKTDRKAFLDLQSRIASREIKVAFVGAGMSVRTGFGNWTDLLSRLNAQAEREKENATEANLSLDEENLVQQHRRGMDPTRIDGSDLAWAAQVIREGFSDASYFATLKSFFSKEPKHDTALNAFPLFGFDHMFTTNYDSSLANAFLASEISTEEVNWRSVDGPKRVMESLVASGPKKPQVIYLHGKYSEPSTIVLSEQDYRDQYVQSDATVRKLYAIFVLKRTVFFGFSFDDVDLAAVFRQVKASRNSPNHFAVLPDAKRVFDRENDKWSEEVMTTEERELKRLRLIEKFGIQPVFYDSSDGKHANFEKVVLALKGGADSLPIPVASPRGNPPPSDGGVGDAVQAGRWTATAIFKERRGKLDPEDPQKGRFGGLSSRNGRELTATVTSEDSWFSVELRVNAMPPAAELEGKVDLWVHDSFPREHYYTFARNGVAKFTFTVWGAFTVGATCDGGKTPLELDLSQVKGPEGWPPPE